MTTKVYNFIIRLMGCFIPFRSARKRFKSTLMIKNRAPNFSIGKFSYYGYGINIGNSKTTIGKYTSIAANVTIGPGEHPIDTLSSSPYFYSLPGLKQIDKPRTYCPPCEIGNDVWIGDKAFVRAGVKIGDGAVIGAHSLVLKDVPPYAVCGGVPARIIKYRFPKDIIEKLIKYKWWDLPDSVVAELPFDDVNAAVAKLEELRNDPYPLPD